MAHEDIVSCGGCGAKITHIICGNIPTINEDPDYYFCESCREEEDQDLDDFEDRLRIMQGGG